MMQNPTDGEPAMQHILIIEDSRSMARLLQQTIGEQLGLAADIAASRAEAEQCIRNAPEPYAIVLCDLTLPDAPHGEAMDMVLAHRLPCVVVTAEFTPALRKRLLHTPICDYVVKSGPRTIRYLVSVLERLMRNEHVTVLVVDDSPSYRNNLADLLSRQRMRVLQAENGRRALEILHDNTDISLVITDYTMPEMDGHQLTEEIRKTTPPDRLSIIVSTGVEDDLASRFLRSGANDFIAKTATFEELVCRINMNLNMLDLISLTRELSERDALTGLSNRRMLYQSGARMLAEATPDIPICAAMLDIDFFKKVNDTYGHEGGDEALRQVGRMLTEHFPPPCLAARYGGEEFCIIFPPGADPAHCRERAEAFRRAVESATIACGQHTFGITVSIGIAQNSNSALEEILRQADQFLYHAKRTGRNRTVQSLPEEGLS